VFPYLPVLAIDRIYGPVAAQFAEDLGRPVHLKTKPTFRKFADELAKGTYDIVLVHPFFYVEARDRHQYLPLARLDEPLTAVIMVRADAPLETLADLKGRTIAMPPELAAVTGLVRSALLEAGLVPGVDVTLEHYRFKPSCLQAVASRRAAACGLPRFALAQIDPNNDQKLRLIFETKPVNNFLFAAHERVPESDRIDLTRSILAWPFTADGRKILAGGAWTRFVPARDQEYDEIRRYMLQLQHVAER
jgi:ABC-type phosphate/phosphonate transport system substrate-binding protein